MPAATARALRGLGGLHLSEFRAWLSSRGLPGRDVLLDAPARDLTCEHDLLDLNSDAVVAAVRGAGSFTELAQGVWAGPGCDLDPASHICGPVLLHAGVRVGPGALVVGPAVLAAGADVGANATVCYSVLAPRARVADGVAVSRRFVPPGVCAVGAAWDGQYDPAAGQREAPLPQAPHAAADGSIDLRRRGGGRLTRLLKRTADVVVSASGLLLLSPLLLAVAALVKLCSRGPIFFGHDREGRGGRVFRCWKFRTMVARAHAQQRALYGGNNVDGPQFKMSRDPRVTRLGRVLRATNIDELPQLYNVLCGDMSLIGPRPSPFRENQICVPWREARLSVRPGITGLWQVCRNARSVGDFHQWIYYDILYVQHQSVPLDLRILLATFVTLGGRFGVPVRWMIPAARRSRLAARRRLPARSGSASVLRGSLVPIVSDRRAARRPAPTTRAPATSARPAGSTEPIGTA
jgi:lipopolysaccharide/colanic/teichoic acid biosynthesis glycosyltransferase